MGLSKTLIILISPWFSLFALCFSPPLACRFWSPNTLKFSNPKFCSVLRCWLLSCLNSMFEIWGFQIDGDRHSKNATSKNKENKHLTCCVRIGKHVSSGMPFFIVFGLKIGHLSNFYLATAVNLKPLNLDIRATLQHRFTHTPTYIHTCIYIHTHTQTHTQYIMCHQLRPKPSKLSKKSSWNTHTHIPTKIILTYRATETDRQRHTEYWNQAT